MYVCTMYLFFVIIVGFLLEANINLFKAFKIGILIISLYRIEFKINGQSQSKKIFCHREEEGQCVQNSCDIQYVGLNLM